MKYRVDSLVCQGLNHDIRFPVIRWRCFLGTDQFRVSLKESHWRLAMVNPDSTFHRSANLRVASRPEFLRLLPESQQSMGARRKEKYQEE